MNHLNHPDLNCDLTKHIVRPASPSWFSALLGDHGSFSTIQNFEFDRHNICHYLDLVIVQNSPQWPLKGNWNKKAFMRLRDEGSSANGQTCHLTVRPYFIDLPRIYHSQRTCNTEESAINTRTENPGNYAIVGLFIGTDLAGRPISCTGIAAWMIYFGTPTFRTFGNVTPSV